MRKGNNQNIIIGVLGTLLVVMGVITIMSLNGTISLSNNEMEETNNNLNSNTEVNDNKDIENTTTTENNNETTQNNNNNVVENYLGKWYLGDGNQDTYTNINIEKNSDSTIGYVIDILVNKEADYKNLDLHCADNSGVCYATGDENHHFSIMMAHEEIVIIPDYGMKETYWTFGTRQK